MLNIKERIDVGLTSSGKVISTSRLNIKVKGFKLQVVGLEKGWNWARTETNNQLPTIYEVELVSINMYSWPTNLAKVVPIITLFFFFYYYLLNIFTMTILHNTYQNYRIKWINDSIKITCDERRYNEMNFTVKI